MCVRLDSCAEINNVRSDGGPLQRLGKLLRYEATVQKYGIARFLHLLNGTSPSKHRARVCLSDGLTHCLFCCRVSHRRKHNVWAHAQNVNIESVALRVTVLFSCTGRAFWVRAQPLPPAQRGLPPPTCWTRGQEPSGASRAASYGCGRICSGCSAGPRHRRGSRAFFGEGAGQAGEAAHPHAHIQVLPLKVRHPDLRHVRLAEDRFLDRASGHTIKIAPACAERRPCLARAKTFRFQADPLPDSRPRRRLRNCYRRGTCTAPPRPHLGHSNKDGEADALPCGQRNPGHGRPWRGRD